VKRSVLERMTGNVRTLDIPAGASEPVPMAEYRVEKDFLGEVKVPKDALWGSRPARDRQLPDQRDPVRPGASCIPSA